MIETDRLILAQWRDEHRAPIAAINADPENMKYFVAPMSRAETDAQVDRQIASQALNGFCFWAIERKSDGVLMGLCGLKTGAPGTPIEHDVEIGWRFDKAFWGQGYASEAARAALAHGFTDPMVPRIASITVPANRASWAVMERIGMTRAHDLDFIHPAVPMNNPLDRHITYLIARP